MLYTLELGPVAQSVEQRIENPCVGGSIPPQATRLHAPQRPFRVLGRFYKNGSFSTKRRNTPRLILKHDGIFRHLATIEESHDGSIVLVLVRRGASNFGWESPDFREGGSLQKVDFETPKQSTLKTTIQTSGRVNYHYQTERSKPVFFPCLLDLTSEWLVVAYVVPAVERLDRIDTLSTSDCQVDLAVGLNGHQTFVFSVVPANLSTLSAEISRLTVKSSYGLACALIPGDSGTVSYGVPVEAFTTIHPAIGLDAQAVQEDAVFLRFKSLVNKLSILNAVGQMSVDLRPPPHIVEKAIKDGPGLTAPNGEGVRTMYCAVPMHRKPELLVKFADSRYTAELVEVSPNDKRLDRVRFRFKIYDQLDCKWVKFPVSIIAVGLDARP